MASALKSSSLFLVITAYFEFCDEGQSSGDFIGSDRRLDHGVAVHLPLSPAASEVDEVVAQREHDLENLNDSVHTV